MSSVIAETIDKIFSVLTEMGVLNVVRKRSNPLVSEYSIRLGKCIDINVNDEYNYDRNVTWYLILSFTSGVKLTVNRVVSQIETQGSTVKALFRLYGGDRSKGSCEFVFSCNTPNYAMYGKSVLDLLLNCDQVVKLLGRMSDKSSDVNELIDVMKKARSVVDDDVRRLIPAYAWNEV